MIKKTIDGVAFLEFELFRDSGWLKHCFSTRIGGVSEGPFASMNFRLKGDSKENVTKNYKRICKAASLSFETLTFSAQEHGANIKTITKDDIGKGFHKERDYSNIDGLITNEPGVLLSTFHADCAAIFLADEVNRAIGIIHAGWRSTIGGIVREALLEMERKYGTRPEDIKAGIGASICGSCFEVDEPVYELFIEYAKHIKPSEQVPDKYFIDLKSVNYEMLKAAGVRPGNIEVSPLCTRCDETLFFSHRRDGDMRGSMAAFMEIIR